MFTEKLNRLAFVFGLQAHGARIANCAAFDKTEYLRLRNLMHKLGLAQSAKQHGKRGDVMLC